jgi:hypothetical protein
MKQLLLAAAILVALAACGAEQNADQAAGGTTVEPTADAAKKSSANAATGIDVLTGLGFIPDFAYGTAYDIVDKNKEGVNRRRVLLEVLEGDIEAAMASAQATLQNAGYSKSKESSDGGRYDAVFVKRGFPTLVFMGQSPERGPKLKNPEAVGTIHIMWNTY